MHRPLLVLLLVAAAALGGCGSEGSDSTGPTGGGSNRFFGDHPGQQATAQRISAADCRELAAAVAAREQQPLQSVAEPTPPNSRCQIEGRGVHVSITLDAAYAARQRYENRMAEQVQFNSADPAKVPHHVPGVGEQAAGEHFAS